jgi:hypothetical protein
LLGAGFAARLRLNSSDFWTLCLLTDHRFAFKPAAYAWNVTCGAYWRRRTALFALQWLFEAQAT